MAITFELEIDTANDAFQDGDDVAEIARLLRQTADQIEIGKTAGKLRDINGNTVGNWSHEQED